jgi:hypothetical protein
MQAFRRRACILWSYITTGLRNLKIHDKPAGIRLGVMLGLGLGVRIRAGLGLGLGLGIGLRLGLGLGTALGLGLGCSRICMFVSGWFVMYFQISRPGVTEDSRVFASADSVYTCSFYYIHIIVILLEDSTYIDA